MVVGVVDDKLCLLEFADRRMLETQFKRLSITFNRPFANLDHRLIQQTAEQLTDYFEGERKEFDIPLATDGSEFQRAVWNELLQIPYGQTTSYERLANRIGKPGAQRAVGRANGDNRLAIVVPCHRVIRSNGEMSGYGGQVWRKKWLLDHEQKLLFQ
jgi:AraC family transcriptional regulator of adaptative response/methylated-DNA-[protein]-cysteine methyltransferase